MDVEIFTICDHAQELSGKLFIVGTFDHISSPVFPVAQPFSIATKIKFYEGEWGSHTMVIKMLDQDSNELSNINGNFMINEPASGDYSSLNFAIALSGQFEKPGFYSFGLFVDDEMLKTLTLHVSKREQPA